MLVSSTHRVLVVTDVTSPRPELLEHLAGLPGANSVRVLVPNPAHGEAPLLHPERHPRAAAADRELQLALPEYARVVSGDVSGAVSIRHDGYEAVEEDLLEHRADRVVVCTHPDGALDRLFHHGLVHRLEHLGLPVDEVRALTPAS